MDWAEGSNEMGALTALQPRRDVIRHAALLRWLPRQQLVLAVGDGRGRSGGSGGGNGRPAMTGATVEGLAVCWRGVSHNAVVRKEADWKESKTKGRRRAGAVRALLSVRLYVRGRSARQK